MCDFPADQHRDPGTLAQLKTIAAAVFARHGIDFAAARRAGGWTNATWLAGGLALRLSVTPGSDNILREARLVEFFPPEVGYPPLLESGITDGYAWSLSRALPGRSLGEVWPELDWEARAAALRQLWRRTRAVHRVDLAALGGLARKQPWFFPAGADEADAALARLAAQRLFTPGQAKLLGASLRRFRETHPMSACVLNHGDLTLDNAFWHAGEVIALFDFEYAVAAPPELDLNELVKMAFPRPPGSRASAGTARHSAGRNCCVPPCPNSRSRCWITRADRTCSRATLSCWNCGCWRTGWLTRRAKGPWKPGSPTAGCFHSRMGRAAISPRFWRGSHPSDPQNVPNDSKPLTTID